MLKQITWFRKRRDLSRTAFAQHWRTRHAVIVSELPGIKRYVQNHVTAESNALDGVAEVWFDDIEAMRANVGRPELDRIRADEPNFLDTQSMGTLVVEPTVVIDGAEEGAKLLVLVRRQAAVAPDEFHRAWLEDVGGALAALAGKAGAPVRYEQDHARVSAYRDGRQPHWDGTASLWFADPVAAGGFFGSEAFAKVASIEQGLMDSEAIRALWVSPLKIV
ncbi:MAG: EthD family reductase [Gammaproteobacteria bacterium]|nr:EthD family reductase [Gammaproteobacteria bacterium]